jgi:hypothetical protein
MKLRKGHRKFIRTYIYKSCNIKDYFFLRYIGNVCKTTNKRLFPECACGKMNDEGHGANECELILNTQKKANYRRKLDRLYNKMEYTKRKNLHEYIIHGYFVLVHRDKTMLKRVISALRSLVFDCVTRSSPEMEEFNRL